jgi:selenium metabolism protein YedF
MQIDARGKGCPIPVMMTDEVVSKIEEGIVEVLVDSEEASLNVEGYAQQNNLFAETVRVGKDWKIKIVKGYLCAVKNPQPVRRQNMQGAAAKTLLLIIGTDALGKDEDLGKKLVKGFFDTMKVTRQLPHTMFFLNAGVKLTTVNDEVVGVLKDIEAMGVAMYSCGTCLKHYDLELMLKVGHRGTTNHIVAGMQDFDKVVWV